MDEIISYKMCAVKVRNKSTAVLATKISTKRKLEAIFIQYKFTNVRNLFLTT